MNQLPEFERGEVCLAADINAIVQAVRSMMVAQGLLTDVRRPAQRMRTFTRSGSAVARADKDGVPVAWGAEILWQIGPHVAVLEGGCVEGLPAALDEAGGAATVGLHADVTWETVFENSYLWTMRASDVCFSAAAWLAPVVGDNGAVTEWRYHGDLHSGCVLPVRGVCNQPQRVLQMWPMPQVPVLVFRQFRDAAAGSCVLLPGADVDQVLACQYGGYYTGGDDGVLTFHRVTHQWLARLDKYGRLEFAARNFTP